MYFQAVRSLGRLVKVSGCKERFIATGVCNAAMSVSGYTGYTPAYDPVGQLAVSMRIHLGQRGSAILDRASRTLP